LLFLRSGKRKISHDGHLVTLRSGKRKISHDGHLIIIRSGKRKISHDGHLVTLRSGKMKISQDGHLVILRSGKRKISHDGHLVTLRSGKRKISQDGHLVILRSRGKNTLSVHFPISVIANHIRTLIPVSGVIVVTSLPVTSSCNVPDIFGSIPTKLVFQNKMDLLCPNTTAYNHQHTVWLHVSVFARQFILTPIFPSRRYNRTASTDFSISEKSVRWEPELIHSDRRMVRTDMTKQVSIFASLGMDTKTCVTQLTHRSSSFPLVRR